MADNGRGASNATGNGRESDGNVTTALNAGEFMRDEVIRSLPAASRFIALELLTRAWESDIAKHGNNLEISFDLRALAALTGLESEQITKALADMEKSGVTLAVVRDCFGTVKVTFAFRFGKFFRKYSRAVDTCERQRNLNNDRQKRYRARHRIVAVAGAGGDNSGCGLLDSSGNAPHKISAAQRARAFERDRGPGKEETLTRPADPSHAKNFLQAVGEIPKPVAAVEPDAKPTPPTPTPATPAPAATDTKRPIDPRVVVEAEKLAEPERVAVGKLARMVGDTLNTASPDKRADARVVLGTAAQVVAGNLPLRLVTEALNQARKRKSEYRIGYFVAAMRGKVGERGHGSASYDDLLDGVRLPANVRTLLINGGRRVG